jgi:hypothetical protein
MPRFRGLSEVIRFHVENLVPAQDIPQALPLSLQMGQGKLLREDRTETKRVLRWGESTWGVEHATSYMFPGQQPETDDGGGLIG